MQILKENKLFIKYSLVIFSILLFLFIYTPSVLFFFGDSNQGGQLSKAHEILQGFHPFVDIAGNVYGPLVFYMSALGQLLSNNRLIGEVIVICIGYLSSYFLLYYLMEKLTKSFKISYLLLLTSLLFLPRFYKYYIVLSPVLVLFSIYYVIFKREEHKGVILLGISCGVSILFRFDFGVYSLIISIVVIYFVFRNAGWRKIRKCFLYFISTVFFVELPFILFLIINNKFPKALIDTFMIVKGMAHGLDLPTPVFDLHQSIFSMYNNISLFFWFFRILPFFALIVILVLWKKVEQKERLFVFFTSIFTILLYVQALNRPHIFHTLQAIPLQFVLISWIFSYSKKEITKRSFSIKLAIISTMLILISLIIPFAKNNHLIKRDNEYVFSLKGGFLNYKDLFLTKEDLRKKYRKKNGLIEIAEFVNKNTKKDESVLFMPVGPQLYYYSERVFKTSLGVLGPGRLTTKKKQLSYFQELIDTKTNVIIDFYEFNYDRIVTRNPRYYYPYLMKLIYSNYKIIRRFGNRTLLCRDERFNKFLINKSPSFDKMLFEDTVFKRENFLVNVYKTNTIPTELAKRITIIKNGVLFCDINIKNKSNKIKKYYLGLKKGSELYFTNLKRLTYRETNNSLEYEVFSSTSGVPVGLYKLIVFYSRGENKWYYQEMPTKITIKNLHYK